MSGGEGRGGDGNKKEKGVKIEKEVGKDDKGVGPKR